LGELPEVNIYFLVEGVATEPKIYRAWLAHLLPKLQEVAGFDEVEADNYFMTSVGGRWPYVAKQITASLNEVKQCGKYDYLVICIDAEEWRVNELIKEIESHLNVADGQPILPVATRLKIIIQNRCIETWLLGNCQMYPAQAKNQTLKNYLNDYNASQLDPERMGKGDCTTHAKFHKKYLRLLFYEQRIRHEETQRNQVATLTYLQQLQARVVTKPIHLSTFQTFLGFCQNLS